MRPFHDLAVVIPHHRGLHLLRAALANLPSELSAGQLLICCDRTPREELDWLEGQRHLRVLTSDAPGFAPAANTGLRRADRPFVLLLNNDAVIAPDDLATLLDWLRAHPNDAAVQPKILQRPVEERPSGSQLDSADGAPRFDHAGAAGGYLDRYGIPFCRGRIGRHREIDRNQHRQALRVFWVSGACGLFRLDPVLRAGALPSSFGSHFEEIDLAWRLHRMGWALTCLPTAQALHQGGGTLGYTDPAKTFLNHRNSLWLLARNLPAALYRRVLPFRLAIDGAAAARHLLTGRPRHALAVLRGTAHGIRNAPKPTQSPTVPPDILYPQSIVRQTVLSGEREWSRLPLNPTWLGRLGKLEQLGARDMAGTE